MSKKNKPPPPPDYTPLASASKENFKEALKFYREYLDFTKQTEVKNRELLNKVLDIQLPIMRAQFENFLSDRQRYEQTFQPVEDQLVQEALTYDTPEHKEIEAGRAAADVNRAFEAQREAALQKLESFGIDPSQTRYAALDRNARIAQAAALAGAQNQARLRTENLGRAMRGEVVNIGRGYPGQVATAAGQAVGAGQSALGGGLNTAQTAAQMRQGALSGLDVADQSIGTWGNVLNTGYQNQLANWNANFARSQAGFNNLLGVASLGAGLFPFADGGEIQAPTVDGSGVDDAGIARVSDGEYVIPADVVRKKGTEFFDKLVEKYHTPADVQRAQGAALPPPVPMGVAVRKPPEMADGGQMEFDYLPKDSSGLPVLAESPPMTIEDAARAAIEDRVGVNSAASTGKQSRMAALAEGLRDMGNQGIVRPMAYEELLNPYYVADTYGQQTNDIVSAALDRILERRKK